MKFRVLWGLLPCSQIDVDRRFVALMLEAVRTSETSVNIYLTTRQYIPEDCELQTRYRENLKSHIHERYFRFIHPSIRPILHSYYLSNFVIHHPFPVLQTYYLSVLYFVCFALLSVSDERLHASFRETSQHRLPAHSAHSAVKYGYSKICLWSYCVHKYLEFYSYLNS
jgi:hypothetical protein